MELKCKHLGKCSLGCRADSSFRAEVASWDATEVGCLVVFRAKAGHEFKTTSFELFLFAGLATKLATKVSLRSLQHQPSCRKFSTTASSPKKPKKDSQGDCLLWRCFLVQKRYLFVENPRSSVDWASVFTGRLDRPSLRAPWGNSLTREEEIWAHSEETTAVVLNSLK